MLANISYSVEALFAALRIALWFILLFGFIAPIFLKHTRDLPIIEKMIYSWIGLGGIIIFSVFILTSLHIYDFISFVLVLLLIPLIGNLWKARDEGMLQFLQNWETRTVVSHVSFIENFKGFHWKSIKNKLLLKDDTFRGQATTGGMVISIALIGGLIRMYPAIINAAPFSRSWFFQLDRIKNLRLQQYFFEAPEPGGMHALVSVFSMLTQLTPEIILHLLGALSSFFLCIIIYWGLKDITRNQSPMAPIFGMSIYALTPMLLMPISLGQQIEANSIDLALCFAIPTLAVFVRNLRAKYKSPWFYVLSGFVATGMINLFVAFVILLPLMLTGILTLPRRRYFKNTAKIFMYLVTISLVILAPIFVFGFLNDIDLGAFFLEQLYDTSAYTFNPSIIKPIDELSIIYLGICGVLVAGYIIESMFKKKGIFRDEIIFLIVFAIVAVTYIPTLELSVFWIDPDQLNAFYALTIALLGGILFSAVVRFLAFAMRLSEYWSGVLGVLMLPLCLAGLLYLQGGIIISRQLPSTVPNGFLSSYYDITDDFLPYSYAIVGPEIKRITAKNRHYFMSYQYFLDEYSAIDSLYQEQLSAVEDEESLDEVPPASIFIFVEKPPYGSIQQGILYNSETVMRDIEQWVRAFKQQKNRTINVYHEDNNTLVYQIINRESESRIGEVLWNINPSKKRRSILSE